MPIRTAHLSFCLLILVATLAPATAQEIATAQENAKAQANATAQEKPSGASTDKGKTETAASKVTKPSSAKPASPKPSQAKPKPKASQPATTPKPKAPEATEQESQNTSPPKGDRDYDLMGEFVGQITGAGGGKQLLGMQVRPTGSDNFEAVSFLGGLPGEEKHNRDGTKLLGRRSGNFLVLSGGPWAVFVEPEHCTLIDNTGTKLGQLKRVRRTSPTLGAKPPKDAVVLFDGTHIDQFTNARMTQDGLLMEGADMKPMFQDFDLHVEFRLPYMPQVDGQKRGNSGVYLQSRYECQILDSFAQDRLINGCGAIYTFRKPDLNMCFPPLVWQTYDIRFTAPRWASDGSKIRNAHITSWLNGVKIHDNIEVPSKTGHGQIEEPLLLPTRLQNHKDPVRFRNVWLIDRGLMTSEFPIRAPKKVEPKPPTPAPKPKAEPKQPAKPVAKS